MRMVRYFIVLSLAIGFPPMLASAEKSPNDSVPDLMPENQPTEIQDIGTGFCRDVFVCKDGVVFLRKGEFRNIESSPCSKVPSFEDLAPMSKRVYSCSGKCKFDIRFASDFFSHTEMCESVIGCNQISKHESASYFCLFSLLFLFYLLKLTLRRKS